MTSNINPRSNCWCEDFLIDNSFLAPFNLSGNKKALQLPAAEPFIIDLIQTPSAMDHWAHPKC